MEALKEVLEILMSVVIIPSIPILAKYAVDALKNWADEKAIETDNKYKAKLLDDISDIISQVVMCTSQTYVDAIKAEGKFDAEAQEIAFNKTKDAVVSLLSQEALDLISELYGDVDLWLKTKIEQKIKENKKAAL